LFKTSVLGAVSEEKNEQSHTSIYFCKPKHYPI